MKRYLYFILALLLGFAVPAAAQRLNTLTIPNVEAMSGSTVRIPILVENTDEIVGCQFDILVPEASVTIDTNAEVTDRSADHKFSVAKVYSGRYRVLAYSPTNAPFKGNGGAILYLNATLAPTCEEGDVYSVNLYGAVLSNKNGENCLTKLKSGKITVIQSPDLTPSDLAIDRDIINPGDTLSLAWKVRNIGSVPTTGGWKEQVFAVSSTGIESLIGTTYYDRTLANAAEISREAKMVMPRIPGVDGECSIRLKIIPTSGSGESELMGSNNVCETENKVNVGCLLYLTSPSKTFPELSRPQVQYKLTRSGSAKYPEDFAVKGDFKDNRVTIPETVKIPYGQQSAYFYIELAPNGKVDENEKFTFNVGNDKYAAVPGYLNIEDDITPGLTVKASAEELNEGDSFELTITLPKVLSADKTIYLTSSKSAKIAVPSEVVIVAGERTVKVPLTVVDNNEAELDSEVILSVLADGYERQECEVLVHDDDMPELEMLLSPDTVSEGAGSSSVIATINRKTNVDKQVRILLMDDANGDLTLSEKSLTMLPGAASAQFSISVRDNILVDGDRKYNIKAAVYSSACDCYVQELSGGSVTSELTVTDNDGPALTLSADSKAFLEGTSENMLTIRRNTKATDALAVSITSDKDDKLDYEHNVTIPAGAATTQVKVSVKANETSGDSDVVSFKAAASGLSDGTCWVILTDRTLPDATISLETVDADVKAGDAIDFVAVVANEGAAPLKRNTPFVISCKGDKNTSTFYTDSAIEPGEKSRITIEDYKLPERVGEITLQAVINPDKNVEELFYDNNKFESPAMTLDAPFDVTVHTDKTIYSQGDVVVISGEASGSSGKQADIEIGINNDGTLMTVSTKTDADGKYEYRHQLLRNQIGHFEVKAGFPTNIHAPGGVQFDVYGLEAYALDSKSKKRDFVTSDLLLGESCEGSFEIRNPGRLPQTGLIIETGGEPANCSVTFDRSLSIGAGQVAKIAYTITPTGLSEGTENYEEIPVTITTAEGAKTNIDILYYVHSPKGKLVSETKSIRTTMTKDVPRDYPMVIRNIGKGETGRISLAFPECIRSAVGNDIASMAPGDSVTLILRLVPTPGMELNLKTSGKFGINCENGDGLSVPYEIVPVSDTKGTLKIDVIDEYTFYSEGQPHVAGASVSVKAPNSDEILAQGTTGEDGIFKAELNEGWYDLMIEANTHSRYSGKIMVNPGEEIVQEVFIPVEDSVTVTWNVEETEVEDEYSIESNADYETNVPKPRIRIKFPANKPTPNSVIPVEVSNEGIIRAANFDLDVSASKGYEIEMLNDPTADFIEPQETMTFYGKLVPDGEKPESDCIQLTARGKWDVMCQRYTHPDYATADKKYGSRDCTGSIDSSAGSSSSNTSSNSGRPRPDVPGSPDNGFSMGNESATTQQFCDPRTGKLPDVEEPIARDTVPSGEPHRIDCKHEPTFSYKLTRVKGKQYVMMGVGADGVSQVKIVLDPQHSFIPEDDCESVSDVKWDLYPNLGKLEQDGAFEAVYTAPDQFLDDLADPTGSIIKVKATMSYTLTIGSVRKGVTCEPVEIWIIRPPIVFVHGLGDSSECWAKFNEELEVNHGYLPGMNYLVNYKNTNTCSFATNVHFVPDGLKDARKHALKYGFVTNKCDIIGHSMGGILARLYAQEADHDDEINRIITVNTPHSGSEVGDLVEGHDIIIKNIARMFYSLKSGNWKDNLSAISDLAVGSEAIKRLNTPSYLPKIPVCALGTETFTESDKWRAEMASLVFGSFVKLSKCASVVTAALAVIGNYVDHIVTDDLLQAAPGDYIVSSESQLGGCMANVLIPNYYDWTESIYDNIVKIPWHVASPSHKDVWEQLELYIGDYGKQLYSKGWFKPKRRIFNHASWDMFATRFIELDPIEDAASMYVDASQTIDEMDLEMNPYYAPSRKAMGESDASTPDGLEQLYLNVEIKQTEGLTDPLSTVSFGDNVLPLEGYKFRCPIPRYFTGPVKLTTFFKNEATGKISYVDREIEVERMMGTPVAVSEPDIMLDIAERKYLYINTLWDDGQTTLDIPEEVTFEKSGIARFENGEIIGLRQGWTNVVATVNGKTCTFPVHVFTPELKQEEETSKSICSTVTLRLSQKMTMTRQAFRGTLTLENGHKSATLRDFRLNLEIKDADGNVATSREFQINTESLDGFVGDLSLVSGWSLDPVKKGQANILFIPTKYAAPDGPKEYSFGGSFSYTDPYTGMTITRELIPQTLTVSPSPELELTYFLQRDVLGDNPITDTVEESVPAEFALLVNNIGNGDARNLRVSVPVPEIIENEKGLAIDFEIVDKGLNGTSSGLSLGTGVTNDFGTLPAGKQSYAQWWLKSPYLGHFTDYKVTATHLNSYDNPNLSLIDTVTIRELIHGFDIRGKEVPTRAFLVNEIEDVEDTPDWLYFTDGSHSMVSRAINESLEKQGENTYLLSVTPSDDGWNYGNIPDPTNGRCRIVSIRRRNGAELSPDNFWLTKWRLRSGKDPMAENLLHFVDEFKNGPQEYIVTFTQSPLLTLAVDKISGIPQSEGPLTEPLTTLTVSFNKEVNVESFTADDIILNRDSERIGLNPESITCVDAKTFKIDLESATAANGLYSVEILTTSISDLEGYAGEENKQITWLQVLGGEVRIDVTASPEVGGTVAPESGTFSYGSPVALSAVPAEGYEFVGWRLEGVAISTEPELEQAADDDKHYEAVFELRNVKLSVECNPDGGHVDGSGAGFYQYGRTVHLEAVPNYGWKFSHWTVDGEKVDDTASTLDITLHADALVEATFVDNLSEVSIPLHQGWNWISSTFDDELLRNPRQFFNSARGSVLEVRSQNESVSLIDGTLKGDLKKMVPSTYKVNVDKNLNLELSGVGVSSEDYEISLKPGWNWIPYLPSDEMSLTDALSGLEAAENDMIKSHSQFSVYSDGGWHGSLVNLKANEGYLLRVSKDGKLSYPASGVTSGIIEMSDSQWEVNEHAHADTETMIAELYGKDVKLDSEAYTVAAFCGEECRGIGHVVDGRYFLSVNGVSGDKIDFIALDDMSGREYSIDGSVSFNDNDALGTYAEPHRLVIGEGVGIEDIYDFSIGVYPNPVKDVLHISGDVEMVTSIRIISMSGVSVISADSVADGINVSALPDGAYLAALSTPHGVVYRKFIKICN